MSNFTTDNRNKVYTRFKSLIHIHLNRNRCFGESSEMDLASTFQFIKRILKPSYLSGHFTKFHPFKDKDNFAIETTKRLTI